MDGSLALLKEFMPHGMCYVWEPTVLWLNVISDAIIALAYFFIPIALFYFLRHRTDIPFRGVIYMFTVFILACGVTHTMAVWTVWHGHYGIQGMLKAVTALASLGCAAMLVPVMPRLLALRTPAELEIANRALEAEIKARRDTESRALQILESSPDAVIIVDNNGIIDTVNAKVEELFGYNRSELLDKPAATLMPDGFAEHLPGLVVEKRLNQFHVERKNGSSFPVEVNLSPLSSPGGPDTLAAIRDVSERVSMEIETQDLRRDLAHLSRLRTVGELATGIAHELNQPLTAIIQNIDTTKIALEGLELVDEEIPELFSEIESSAYRASETIRALRRFVRNENTEKSAVDINDLIVRTVRLVKAEADANAIEIKTIHKAEDKPTIDPTQIAQVIVNLLRNGIEAIIEAQSKVREIVIQTTQNTEHTLLVSVSDSGPGIEPDLDLFDPFQSRKDNGMGIGLSISRSIVEAHGGTLKAETSKNAGAKFSFDLPLGDSSER